MEENERQAARPQLRVVEAGKAYGRFTALDRVSFSAARGEFISVLGPSGCGKTTLLRVIAGLEPQTGGEIHIGGREVSRLPVSRRNVGIVFQSYALFPNLTAAQNVAYGLSARTMDRARQARRVDELIDLVGLTGHGRKYPAQLSGGQQQRVALARAMALSPDLLLLDEPLSALDAKVRVMLRGEIRRLQRRLGLTTIMVTHDQEEALTMADRILVMERGRVVQDGSPHEIYDRPATPFVASFIGSMNFIPDAQCVSGGTFRKGLLVLSADDGRGLPPGAKATVAIRPEDVLLGVNGEAGANVVLGKVQGLEYRGAGYRLTLQLVLYGEERPLIEAEVSTETLRRLGLREDMVVSLTLPPERIRIYPATQGGHA
jgi:iron(III) transport system ATP-binding protein